MKKELINIAVQLEYHAEHWFSNQTYTYMVLMVQAKRIRAVVKKYQLLRRRPCQKPR